MFINGEFNRGRNLLEHEFREGRSKSFVVPKTIDAKGQLILQDRHVTYHGTETTLGISGTSIHSILHELLIVKKFVRLGCQTVCQQPFGPVPGQTSKQNTTNISSEIFF